MNILLVAPSQHPIRHDSRYIGIEREVWLYSRELVKNHKVSVIAHAKSEFPEGVTLLGVDFPSNYQDLELKAFQVYQHLFRTFDVIHDWSHLHLISRFMVNLPTLSIFFHAPELARYPKAPYNIIALSEWAAKEFHRFYGQKARYQYSVGIDHDIYKLPRGSRGDRFLAIGRMAEEKGNLEAARLCHVADVPMDICGGRGFEKTGSDPPTEYENAVLNECDGKQVKFLGEVDEDQKVKLMKRARGLIYATNHPEVTSHKIQEAMFCGCPIIAPRLGALPEIITDGVNGFLCDRMDGFLSAIKSIDKLDISKKYDEIIERFEIKNVVNRYIPLYEEVAQGLRWK